MIILPLNEFTTEVLVYNHGNKWSRVFISFHCWSFDSIICVEDFEPYSCSIWSSLIPVRSASSSTVVDALKFRLVQYNKFYGGQNQQDGMECLMMLTELINKDSVPYCGSNCNNAARVSLSELLFSFMLEKYIVCDACGLRSPSF